MIFFVYMVWKHIWVVGPKTSLIGIILVVSNYFTKWTLMENIFLGYFGVVIIFSIFLTVISRSISKKFKSN